MIPDKESERIVARIFLSYAREDEAQVRGVYVGGRRWNWDMPMHIKC
jgi:hypothetical protein